MNYLRMTLALATVAITGCATVAPGNSQLIGAEKAVSANHVSLESVRNEPQSYVDVDVHWGGVVEKIEYRDNNTWVEVIGRPLDTDGLLLENSKSEGRFIAIVPEFLEPTDYKQGSLITISGKVEGIHTRPIGEIAYDFPTVSVDDYQLWLPRQTVAETSRSYLPYYISPHFGKVSIGFGLGRHSSLRFGIGKRSFSKFGHRSGHRFGRQISSRRGGHRRH